MGHEMKTTIYQLLQGMIGRELGAKNDLENYSTSCHTLQEKMPKEKFESGDKERELGAGPVSLDRNTLFLANLFRGELSAMGDHFASQFQTIFARLGSLEASLQARAAGKTPRSAWCP